MYLYNTFSKKKEKFTPINEKNAKLYVCGPTVYNYIHIGNARAMIVFDMLFRILQLKFPVIYVRNITDIDDKILNKAREEKKSPQEVARFFNQKFQDDLCSLNCLKPTHQPTVTKHIPEIISMIERLIENKNAYVKDGEVYFSVKSFSKYGRLSGRISDNELMNDGNSGKTESIVNIDGDKFKKDSTSDEILDTVFEALQIDSKKEDGDTKNNSKKYSRLENEKSADDLEDFVLWKKDEKNLDFCFESPWGLGRPGWHIECSAMSKYYLGSDFDIHGGGIDLTFPHHENEIAQSCCANPGSNFAKHWMHNEFVNIKSEKMSKSLGNFITVRQLIDSGVNPEIIRYALMSTHYRQVLNWSDELLFQSKNDLDRLYRALYLNNEDLDNDATENDESFGFYRLENEKLNQKNGYNNQDLNLNISQDGNFNQNNELSLGTEDNINNEDFERFLDNKLNKSTKSAENNAKSGNFERFFDENSGNENCRSKFLGNEDCNSEFLDNKSKYLEYNPEFFDECVAHENEFKECIFDDVGVVLAIQCLHKVAKKINIQTSR